MDRDKTLDWILRIGVFGIFFGHGIWALSIKQGWFGYFTALGIAETSIPALLTIIGVMDVLVGLTVLWRPYKFVLAWAILWSFATAAIRPATAMEPLFSGFFSIELMDLIERFGNFMMPLALLVWRGWPQRFKEWFTF